MVCDSAVVLDIQCRGGSRVVQVISRNHSNVSKPAFVISQVLYCVQEIRYPSCFVVKQRKKRRNSLFPRSHGKPSPSRANSTSRYFREQRQKIRWHDRRSLYPVGGTGWYMYFVTNHSKPTSIGQKHSHCLANNSKSVVIGYSGRKLPWKLLTIVYNGKPLPRSPFVCSC